MNAVSCIKYIKWGWQDSEQCLEWSLCLKSCWAESSCWNSLLLKLWTSRLNEKISHLRTYPLQQ